MNRFQSWNDHIIQYDLLSKNNMENVMQMPRFTRIDLNSGVGKGVASIDRKQMIGALFSLEFISGQKPSITRAKKSIDKFKLREKMMIGCKVTLRKKKMFFFLDRLIHKVLADQGSSDFARPKKSATLGGKKARLHNLAFGIENVHGAFKELQGIDLPCGMNISVRSRTIPGKSTPLTQDPGMTDGFQMPWKEKQAKPRGTPRK